MWRHFSQFIGLRLGLLFLGLGALGLAAQNLRDSLVRQSPRHYRDRSTTLFVPSPLESRWLSGDKTIWPQAFDSESPPHPSSIPRLYGLGRLEDVVGGLAEVDRERARLWSVLAASENREALREDLSRYAKPFELSRLKNPRAHTCHIMDLELIFRWAQLEPSLQGLARERLSQCQPDSVLIPWIELLSALEQKDLHALMVSHDKLKQLSLIPGRGWSGWFAGEAALVAERLLPHE